MLAAATLAEIHLPSENQELVHVLHHKLHFLVQSLVIIKQAADGTMGIAQW